MMRSLILTCAVIASIAGADIVFDSPPAVILLRPGLSTTIDYNIVDGPASHTVVFSSVPTGISCTDAISGSTGRITIKSTASASISGAIIHMSAKSGSTVIAQADLPTVEVNTPPTLVGTSPSTTSEDVTFEATLTFRDDLLPLSFSLGASTGLTSHISTTIDRACTVIVTPDPDFYGTASLVITVTDAMGPTDITVPITVTAANDPPVVAWATAPPAVAMDPRLGVPVPLGAALDITKGVDANVTLKASGQYLAWEAAIDGVSGIDLLTLADANGYAIGTTAISKSGTTRASWTYVNHDTTRIRVTVGSSGSQIHLQDIANLLHYTCVQGGAVEQVRTLTLTVLEPNGTGGQDAAIPVTATCTVLAQNDPPVVTASALEVVPEGSAPIVLAIDDSDTPTGIIIRVADPLPRAGLVTPLSCTAQELAAGVMRYTHSDLDESADLIHLTVDDGRNTPVPVQVPVSIRMQVDRMAVLSDPCLEVQRDTTATWPMRFSCVTGSVTVATMAGINTLPLPAGSVSYASTGAVTGELRFDWSHIPAETSWLPVTVTANTSNSAIDDELRQTKQRMMIRIRPRPPVADQSRR
jgi:hypothetical protein